MFVYKYPAYYYLSQDCHDHFFSNIVFDYYNYTNVERVFEEVYFPSIGFKEK